MTDIERNNRKNFIMQYIENDINLTRLIETTLYAGSKYNDWDLICLESKPPFDETVEFMTLSKNGDEIINTGRRVKKSEDGIIYKIDYEFDNEIPTTLEKDYCFWRRLKE